VFGVSQYMAHSYLENGQRFYWSTVSCEDVEMHS